MIDILDIKLNKEEDIEIWSQKTFNSVIDTLSYIYKLPKLPVDKIDFSDNKFKLFFETPYFIDKTFSKTYSQFFNDIETIMAYIGYECFFKTSYCKITETFEFSVLFRIDKDTPFKNLKSHSKFNLFILLVNSCIKENKKLFEDFKENKIS